MKKRLLITFLLLFVVVTGGFAQGKVEFGLKGGYNNASVTKASGTRNRVHLGGVARINISDKFAIQPELLYSLQGGEIAEVDFSANYLSLPILSSYNLVDNLYVEIGPEFSYLTYAEVKPLIITKYIDKLQISFDVGTSYRFKNDLFVQLRYCLGLKKLSDNKEHFNFDVKNKVFQASIGYFF